MWCEKKAFAIAIFPYSSSKFAHLNLITGDHVEIFEECQEWVRAKCLSNFSVGICPKNRLKIISDFSQYNSRNCINLEARSILNVLFSKFFIPSNRPSISDHVLFDNIFSLLSYLDKQNPDQTPISSILDQIRNALSIPQYFRTENHEIMTFHSFTPDYIEILKNPQLKSLKMPPSRDNSIEDTSINGVDTNNDNNNSNTSNSNVNINKRDAGNSTNNNNNNTNNSNNSSLIEERLPTLYFQNNSIIPYQIKYQPMLDIIINYIIDLPFNAKSIVRLIDVTKYSIISESSTFFFPQETSYLSTVTFDNILISTLPKLAVHFIILSETKSQTENSEVLIYEYKGSNILKFGQDSLLKNISLLNSYCQYSNVPLYISTNSDLLTYLYILTKNDNAIYDTSMTIASVTISGTLSNSCSSKKTNISASKTSVNYTIDNIIDTNISHSNSNNNLSLSQYDNPYDLYSYTSGPAVFSNQNCHLLNPNNIGRMSSINKVHLYIVTLFQSNPKPVSYTVKLLNIKTNEFLPVFIGQTNPQVYTSLKQTGKKIDFQNTLSISITDIINYELSLDTTDNDHEDHNDNHGNQESNESNDNKNERKYYDIDLTNYYFIIEINRPEKLKRIRYAYIQLFRKDGTIISYPNLHTVKFSRLPIQSMGAKQYSDVIRAFKQPENKPEVNTAKEFFIDVILHSTSTYFSDNPTISNILYWKKKFNTSYLLPATLKDYPLQFLLPKILHAFSEILRENYDGSNENSIENDVIQSLLNIATIITSSLDSDGSSPLLNILLQFIQNDFTPENESLIYFFNPLISKVSDKFSIDLSHLDRRAKMSFLSFLSSVPMLIYFANSSLRLYISLLKSHQDSQKGSVTSDDCCNTLYTTADSRILLFSTLCNINKILQSCIAMLNINDGTNGKQTASIKKLIITTFPLLTSFLSPLLEVLDQQDQSLISESSSIVQSFFVSLKRLYSVDSSTEDKQFLIQSLSLFTKSSFFINENQQKLIIDLFRDAVLNIYSPQFFDTYIYPFLIDLFYFFYTHSFNLSNSINFFSPFIQNLLDIENTRSSKNSNTSSSTTNSHLNDSTSISNTTNTTNTSNSNKSNNEIFDSKRALLFPLIYFMNENDLGDAIIKSSNPELLYSKLLDTIRNAVKPSTPPHIFFILPFAFIHLVQLSDKPEFSFVHSQLTNLMKLISTFYSDFLKVVNQINHYDSQYFSMIYDLDLQPIAALLPALLKNKERSGDQTIFNQSVLLPLFHFYLTQKSTSSENSISESFRLILSVDFKENNSYQKTENAVIQALDQLTNSVSINVKELFPIYELTEQIMPNTTKVEHFFRRLRYITSAFSDISVYENEKINEDEKVDAIIAVLDLCKKNKNFTLFSHFTSKLYEFQTKCGNYVEAAATLVELANTISWEDKEIITEDHGEPEQPRYLRKQAILQKAVDFYMKEKFYEKAIEVLRELEIYFREINIDYDKVSQIYGLMSECYHKISEEERNILSRFYGVRFYGPGFSNYFSRKMFIYRRNGFFMNDQMLSELADKFPNATISPKPPSNEDLEKPYIHVFNVDPMVGNEIEIPKFEPTSLSSSIMAKSVNDISHFYAKAPIRVRREDGKTLGEFSEWHRKITKYTTQFSFPGLSRRSIVLLPNNINSSNPSDFSQKDSNFQLDDSNISLNDSNISLNDSNISLFNSNISLNDSNISLSDSNISHNEYDLNTIENDQDNPFEEYLMSPIQCAIYDTNAKTSELLMKTNYFWRCLKFGLEFHHSYLSEFFMLMNGIANAAVNGGTQIFQELFFASPMSKEEECLKHIDELKDAFADQLKVMNYSIQLYLFLSDSQFDGLYQSVVSGFQEMKTKMEEVLGEVDLLLPAKIGVIPDLSSLSNEIEAINETKKAIEKSNRHNKRMNSQYDLEKKGETANDGKVKFLRKKKISIYNK